MIERERGSDCGFSGAKDQRGEERDFNFGDCKKSRGMQLVFKPSAVRFCESSPNKRVFDLLLNRTDEYFPKFVRFFFN